MSQQPHLLTEDQEEVLVVTLNRPDKLNAITNEMLQLFEQALLRFRDTAELKVMLIRSTGRYFCSGSDLRWDSFFATQQCRNIDQQPPLSASRKFRTAAKSLT